MISLAGLDDVEEMHAAGPSLRGTREEAGFTVDTDQDCGKWHVMTEGNTHLAEPMRQPIEWLRALRAGTRKGNGERGMSGIRSKTLDHQSIEPIETCRSRDAGDLCLWGWSSNDSASESGSESASGNLDLGLSLADALSDTPPQ